MGSFCRVSAAELPRWCGRLLSRSMAERCPMASRHRSLASDAIVHVAVGPGDHLLVVDADLHAVEHEAGSPHHAGLHGLDGVGRVFLAGLDHEGVVERGVDGDPSLVPEDGGQAHHLGTVALHRGVHERRAARCRLRRTAGPRRRGCATRTPGRCGRTGWPRGPPGRTRPRTSGRCGGACPAGPSPRAPTSWCARPGPWRPCRTGRRDSIACRPPGPGDGSPAVAHSGASLDILANHRYGSPLAMASSMCWSPLRAAAITNSWDFQSRYARTRPRGGLIRPRNQRLGPKMDLPAWCALRPVLHTNWPSMQRLRPSAPRVIEFSRSLAMVCRSWCRCASCGYSSDIALKVSSRRSGAPDCVRGPGDVLPHQVVQELVGDEAEAVIDPILRVVLGHQARANSIPVTGQATVATGRQAGCRCVPCGRCSGRRSTRAAGRTPSRSACPLCLAACAAGARPGRPCRASCRRGLAPLLGRLRTAAQDQLDHRGLLEASDQRQPVAAHGRWQALAALHRVVGGRAAELGLQVEHGLRDRPPERQVAPRLGARVVADPQPVRIGRERRARAELFPQLDPPPRAAARGTWR